MKKVFALALTVLMVMSMFAGCGSSNTTKTTTEAPAATAAETTAAATTAAETAAAELKTVESGKLIMSTNAAFPPYEMVADDGSFEGIDVEIAGKIAEKLGLELVVDDMDFGSVITSVQAGKSDIAMAGLTVTDERSRTLTSPILCHPAYQMVIVPEDSDIKTIDDLQGKLIGCQESHHRLYLLHR